MFNLFFGERLHKLRKSRGLSLEEVALGVGVTSSHISQLENDKRQPSFSLITDLSNFFDVDPTFFIETRHFFFGHGRKIRTFREMKGLSIVELALKAGIEPTYLAQVEDGRAKLDKADLEKVSGVLGKDLIDFNDGYTSHLNTIREICSVVFNMSSEDIEEVVGLIKGKSYL